VICDNGVYKVSGTVDGQAADSVQPATIPGSTKGTVEVIVTRGDTSVRTSVTVNGDCGAPPTTATTPTTAATTTATTPTTTTTPPTATTPAKPSTPKTVKPPKQKTTSVKKAVKKQPKLTGNPKVDKCKDLGNGTMRCKGVVVTQGSG
jgi:hypothetical protein